MKLTINGRDHDVDADPDMPLLWVLRDVIGLTGTKFGCGAGQCGACTVHLDGQPIRACITPVGMVQGQAVVTIEGVTIEGLAGKERAARAAAAVTRAWTALDVPQCGYCQSGQVMAATALLTANPKPTDADIDAAMEGNLCRCATYQRIRAGVHEASRMLEA